MKTQTATIDLEMSWHLASLALISAIVLMMPDVLFAAAGLAPSAQSDVGNYICNIADNFTGNAGRGIATIGISVLGTLALLGRVTWTQALVIGVGCSVLFGAPYMIVSMGGAQGFCYQA